MQPQINKIRDRKIFDMKLKHKRSSERDSPEKRDGKKKIDNPQINIDNFQKNLLRFMKQQLQCRMNEYMVSTNQIIKENNTKILKLQSKLRQNYLSLRQKEFKIMNLERQLNKLKVQINQKTESTTDTSFFSIKLIKSKSEKIESIPNNYQSYSFEQLIEQNKYLSKLNENYLKQIQQNNINLNSLFDVIEIKSLEIRDLQDTNRRYKQSQNIQPSKIYEFIKFLLEKYKFKVITINNNSLNEDQKIYLKKLNSDQKNILSQIGIVKFIS